MNTKRWAGTLLFLVALEASLDILTPCLFRDILLVHCTNELEA